MKTPGRPIRWQLTRLCLGLLIPTLLFAGVLLWQFAVSERSRVEEQARALSRSLAVSLDREVNGVLTTLQALATSPSLQQHDLPGFYAQITEIHRLQGIHISLRSVDGLTVMTTRAPLGAAIPVSAALTRTDREVLRTGQPGISNVFTGAASGHPVFQIVAAPVMVGGARTYLLAASIDLDLLAAAIRQEALPPGWIAALLDRDGVFAVRTEQQDAFAGKPTTQAFRDRLVGDSGSYYGPGTSGRWLLAGYARSALTGWTASANLGAELVDVPLERSLLLLVVLGLLLILIAVAVALRVARRVNGAMRRLGGAAEAIGRGQPLQPLVTPIQEVNDVGRALVAASNQVRDRARERDTAEAALRDLNETLEAQVVERTRERDRAWRNSRDLQVVLRRDGVFEALSPALTGILGWTTDEVRGRPVFDLLHPDDADAARTILATATQDGVPEFENRLRHKDGSFRWLSWVAAAEADRVFASGRDIGAHKAQADALRDAEAALRQAQKMEAVGQLTGGIAHDFNNLLAGIMGSLELMQTRLAQGRTDTLDRYAKAAMGSAQRAAALTHRLLAFSRRQPLDPRPVAANTLVASMEDLLRRTIGPLHAFHLIPGKDLWTTLCDPHQLENAILNLVINARDAMPDGGTLTIETCNRTLDDAYVAQQRDAERGQYVCIRVGDSGAGMTPDVASRAFEPFFTTKPAGQGTGLGLSMVYGFARQSEGHLTIDTAPGQGTTVSLYLPRHRGASTPDQPAAQPADPTPRAEPGHTVLVVEDEPAIRALVVDLLQDLGYHVLAAEDGPSGLARLQSPGRIDLVVSDLGLPGLNGRQLVAQARETRPDLKALFITGYAEGAIHAHGFLEPGMEMLTKPFTIEALATRVARMIRPGTA